MYCRQCGNQLDDDARFCEKCGASVPSMQTELKSNDKKKSEKDVQENIATDKNREVVKETTTNTPLSNRNRVLAIVAVVIALLCVGTIFLVKLEGKNDYQQQEATTQVQGGEMVQEGQNTDYSVLKGELQNRFAEYVPSQTTLDSYNQLMIQLDAAIAEDNTSMCGSIYTQLQTLETTAQEESKTALQAQQTEVEGLEMDSFTDAERFIVMQEYNNGVTALGESRFATAQASFSFCKETYKDVLMDGDTLSLNYRQVDVSNYPIVRLYVEVENEMCEAVTDLDGTGFSLYEYVQTENIYKKMQIRNARIMNQTESLNIGICADVSASMGDYGMVTASDAMCDLVDCLQTDVNDRAALYTFSDFVDRPIYYTSDKSALKKKINNIEMGNMTSLYDAIGYALSEIIVEDGAKCVIAFTDGIENYSYLSKDYIIEKAQSYNIPVYLIGVGYDVDEYELESIASSTGGEYYNINSIDGMSEVYQEIYREQKSRYVIEYETQNDIEVTDSRWFYLTYKDSNRFAGEEDVYVPSDYKLYGYIFHDSDSRYLSEDELDELTEIEVKIALNEIYARRGYKFHTDEGMIAHFNSCDWYEGKYKDMNKVYKKFNKYEKANVELLVDYEIKYNLNGREK